MKQIAPKDAAELERVETREWLDSFEYVLQHADRDRVVRLLDALSHRARQSGVRVPFSAVTPYINTIPADAQQPLPGSQEIERRIKSLIRWNALSMVVRANRISEGIGGHISTYASAATLYEVGFNHFFRGKSKDSDGDLIYFQGHASPGIYARAYLEGRLSVEKLENFRRELQAGRRPVVLPASVADAGLLGVPDGLDGPRADHGDLPGALPALPRGSRAQETVRHENLGVSG